MKKFALKKKKVSIEKVREKKSNKKKDDLV